MPRSAPGGGGWGNRIIQDVKASQVNLLSSAPERAALPRGIDRAVDVAIFFTADGSNRGDIRVIFLGCLHVVPAARASVRLR